MRPVFPYPAFLCPVFLFFACCCATAGAEDLVITQVRIIVKSRNLDVPTAGRLYRVVGDKAQPEFVAHVDGKGNLDKPYACSSAVQLVARPDRGDVAPRDLALPCAGDMVFRFAVPKVIDASGYFASGSALTDEGRPEAAQFAFSQAAWAAARSGDTATATVAGNAAVYAAAKALGDGAGAAPRLAAPDPAQANQVVFTAAGKEAIKQFQRDADIAPTGQLDFKTQKALSDQPSPDLERLKKSSGDWRSMERR